MSFPFCGFHRLRLSQKQQQARAAGAGQNGGGGGPASTGCGVALISHSALTRKELNSIINALVGERERNTLIYTEDIMILDEILPSGSSSRFEIFFVLLLCSGKNISGRPASSFIYESCLLRPALGALIGISSEHFHFGPPQHEAADEEAEKSIVFA